MKKLTDKQKRFLLRVLDTIQTGLLNNTLKQYEVNNKYNLINKVLVNCTYNDTERYQLNELVQWFVDPLGKKRKQQKLIDELQQYILSDNTVNMFLDNSNNKHDDMITAMGMAMYQSTPNKIPILPNTLVS